MALGMYNCPCCNKNNSKDISITTDWGYEYFKECLDCGILFRELTNQA